MAGNNDREDKPAKPPWEQFGEAVGKVRVAYEQYQRGLRNVSGELPAPSDSPPAVRRLSKKWIPVAFERRRRALLAMGISAAARELAKESETAPDCVGPMKDRYAEQLLRVSGAFSKAYQGGL
jgi:hypothetical protein